MKKWGLFGSGVSVFFFRGKGLVFCCFEEGSADRAAYTRAVESCCWTLVTAAVVKGGNVVGDSVRDGASYVARDRAGTGVGNVIGPVWIETRHEFVDARIEGELVVVQDFGDQFKVGEGKAAFSFLHIVECLIYELFFVGGISRVWAGKCVLFSLVAVAVAHGDKSTVGPDQDLSRVLIVADGFDLLPGCRRDDR